MDNKAFVTTLPDFVEIQRASFCWFLSKGLSEELENFSSITDFTNSIELTFFGYDYKIRKPKYDIIEAKKTRQYIRCPNLRSYVYKHI